MRSRLAKKNALANVLYLTFTSFVSFLMRQYLIRYFGVEILGVNGVVADIVSTITLVEAGIQTAIGFRLYKPIAENDINREGEIFSLFSQIYKIIGFFIFVLGILIIPFIKYIVDTSIDIKIVIIVYLIQLVNVTLPYFFAYKRILCLVHQQQYKCTEVDVVVTIITQFIQLFVLMVYKNYILYLLVSYFKVIISNLIINKECDKIFGVLHKKYKVKKQDKIDLLNDVKELFLGNFAGYVYHSTDSIIISTFCGTILVGYLSNYKMLINLIRSFIATINGAVAPSWGDFLNRDTTKTQIKEMYYMFTFLEYLCCSLTLIPVICLSDLFVGDIWIGKDYIIDKTLILLIVADVFINAIHEPNAIVIRSLGMFQQDKWNSILATIINLLISVVLAVKIGMSGVLIGTVIALLFFWIVRSKNVNEKCFDGNLKEYIDYWIKNIIYVTTFIVQSCICINVGKLIDIDNVYIRFILWGGLIEGICLSFNLLIYSKTQEMKNSFSFFFPRYIKDR